MAFSEPNKWNNFYETLWRQRTKAIKDIIDSGETHPLRVLGQFESLTRYSKLGGTWDDPHLNTDTVYEPDADQNIIQGEPGRIQFKVEYKLPTGLPSGLERVYGDEKIVTSTLMERGHISLLLDYLRHREYDAVVELGSGLGGNLVRLHYQGGPRVPYYACEYTESGAECASLLAGLTDEFDLRSHRFDYTDPDLSFVEETGRVFVFSCHSIEQVEKIPPHLFKTIAAVADHVTCMHLEPCGWQFAAITNTITPVDQAQRDFFVQRKWNSNLLEETIRAHHANEIQFKYFGKNMIESTDSTNPASIVIWESV